MKENLCGKGSVLDSALGDVPSEWNWNRIRLTGSCVGSFQVLSQLLRPELADLIQLPFDPVEIFRGMACQEIFHIIRQTVKIEIRIAGVSHHV